MDAKVISLPAENTNLLTALDVAVVLRWDSDERTAKRRLRAIPPRELPYHRIGRARFYRLQDIEGFIAKRRVA